MIDLTVGERIEDLMKQKGIKQKELSKLAGVCVSQLSRIQNGIIQKPSNKDLKKLADFFGVSPDFLLGNTPFQAMRNYEVSKLGLTEKSVKKLISGNLDTDVVNSLLEHEGFAALTKTIKIHFADTRSAELDIQNMGIEFAIGELEYELTHGDILNEEIEKDIALLESQKLKISNTDEDKIKLQFSKIISDIKSTVPVKISQGQLAGKSFLQNIFYESRPVVRSKINRTAEAVISAVMKCLFKVIKTDEKGRQLLTEAFTYVIKTSNDSAKNNDTTYIVTKAETDEEKDTIYADAPDEINV